MKFLSLLMLLFLLFSHGWSQLPNSTYSLGGSIDFSFGTSEQSSSFSDDILKTDHTNLTISPSVDYFIIDNFSVGLILMYRQRNHEIVNDYSNHHSMDYTENSISIGPQIRYYIQYDEKIYPFISIIYQYGNSITDNESKAIYYAKEFNRSSNEFRFGIGLSIFLINGLAIEPITYYDVFDSELSVKYPDRTDKTDYNYRQLNINIGLKYYIH